MPPKQHLGSEVTNVMTKHVVSWSGVLALAATACASTSGGHTESANPKTQQVTSSQQAAEQALQRAADAQKRATEQAQTAAQAQAQVQKDGKQLRQDLETAQQEQAKAQLLQAEANQERAVANRQATEQQQLAESALSQQTRQAGTGEQMATGVVTQVRRDEVSVQPATGDVLRIRINRETQVRFAGKQGSAEHIKAGQVAQVSYKPSAEGPVAVAIAIGTAGLPSAATGTGSSASGSTGQ
jgi:hypothetical protein